MITSIETHHRYGDKRCVPCGMTKERATTGPYGGCSSADCPWKQPSRETPEELEAKYGHLMFWRIS